MPKRKRKVELNGDWERVLRIAKVEEPVSPAAIAHRLPDLKFFAVADIVDSMVRAGLLRYEQVERGGTVQLLVVCRD